MNQQVTQVSKKVIDPKNGANCRYSFANGTTNYVTLATDGRGTDLYQRKEKSNVAAGRGRKIEREKDRERERERERKREREKEREKKRV